MGKNIWGIILASGCSTRMGRPKLLLPYKGKSIIRHVIDESMKSRLSGVVAVINPKIAGLRNEVSSSGVSKLVLNEQAAQGMSTSLKAGLMNLPPTAAAVVLLGDQPLVTSNDIDAVIRCYEANEGTAIVQASYQSKRGHPVLFDCSMFPHLFHVTGDEGARSVLKTFANQIRFARIDKPFPDDIDTPEDYEQLLRKEAKLNE
ncbi:NTP transferase domain-containing protein [Parageobacillus thermoglucosidasius]|uniref:4-diphosphocytidyl-2C-methyl-D-erythritol synthase n=3 Tax=Bacillota TaxID=1239 RepID=A0A7U3YG33_GEOS0|nr:nucleotidyltransferase family protein [Parageobacillus thermoglucosidasius]REK53152.1 MAG: nucleotidyltransferase family protein [Geobacillus sp.]MED4906434.1 nucleotidyltransferase family protein [Parageobacillus thermoglucosidasius]MED4915341.1 nucleotidyltransferase family protein [Parageobacillus thermoglucosidasius]MED4943938.1 nucleotidyltransferase family protein [Parageobacillus thermoglucosidasius]MED4982875.1 nucleotidyltransferase family protein [Parageobacillus thermoglucosidasi